MPSWPQARPAGHPCASPLPPHPHRPSPSSQPERYLEGRSRSGPPLLHRHLATLAALPEGPTQFHPCVISLPTGGRPGSALRVKNPYPPSIPKPGGPGQGEGRGRGMGCAGGGGKEREVGAERGGQGDSSQWNRLNGFIQMQKALRVKSEPPTPASLRLRQLPHP